MAQITIDGSVGPTERQYYFLVLGNATDQSDVTFDQGTADVGPFTVIHGLVITGTDRWVIDGPVLQAYLGEGEADYFYEGTQFTSPAEIIQMSGGDQTTVDDEIIEWTKAVAEDELVQWVNDIGGCDTGTTDPQEPIGDNKNLERVGLLAGGILATRTIEKLFKR